MRYISGLFIILIGVLSFQPGKLVAAQKAVEVFADQVEFDINSYTTVFKQNVRILLGAYQGNCHQATVYVDPKTRKMVRIVMQGGVTIKKGDSVFKGEQVIFDAKSNKIYVKGQVYTRLETENSWQLNTN